MMVDATNGVGPLGNQQFSTKGVKLSDLKEKNQLLFNYFKQAGLNETFVIVPSSFFFWTNWATICLFFP